MNLRDVPIVVGKLSEKGQLCVMETLSTNSRDLREINCAPWT